MDKIRVLIADDHRVVRRGLSIFLNAFQELEYAGEAANGLEAIHLCPEVKLDVILMDILMPEMDGIMATSIIRQSFPHIQVIALTSLRDEHLIDAMMHAGAASYLLKTASIDQLANTIIAVNRNALPAHQ